MQALGDLASPVQGTLIPSAFALRGVSQAVAPPASEIAPAVDVPASPAATQAAEPLPLAAEHGGRVGEGDELGDVNRRAPRHPVAIAAPRLAIGSDRPVFPGNGQTLRDVFDPKLSFGTAIRSGRNRRLD